MVSVLDIEARNGSPQSILLFLALLERARASQSAHQEIEVLIANRSSALWTAAAVLAIEGEDAIAFVCVPNVQLILYPFSAEHQLVFTMHPGHIVVNRPCIVVEVRH